MNLFQWFYRNPKESLATIDRRKRNAMGKSLGFGTCMHCGDSWYWKKECDIRYAIGSGMFPLCQDCFNELPFETIIEYCQKLWNEWSKPKNSERRPEDFPALIIAKSVELVKSGQSQWRHPMLDEITEDQVWD